MKAKQLTFILFLLSTASFAQDNLDLQKNADAELFKEKKGFNIQQRIEEIKYLDGKTVTVFHVSGKENKIKVTYTGTVRTRNYPNMTDKARYSLITVDTKDENSVRRSYYPLTNDKRYRIYLTEKLK